ncbi:MAG TPA: MFS transporter [Actinomycetes bacterium]
MIGAPVAGVLIAATSAPLVIAIDAATFVVSAVLVTVYVPRSAQPGPKPADEEPPTGYLAALREGFAHLRGDRLLLGIAVMVAVTNLLDQALPQSSRRCGQRRHRQRGRARPDVRRPGLGRGHGERDHDLGRPAAAPPADLRVGLPDRWQSPLFVLAALSSVSPVLAVAFIAGLGVGGINPILGAVEHERVPRHLQTRVLGALGATAWAGIPVGTLLGGALVDGLGLRAALVITGVAYLITTLAPFVFPARRGMDDLGPTRLTS